MRYKIRYGGSTHPGRFFHAEQEVEITPAEIVDGWNQMVDQVQEYENAITWNTSCLNCASLLDASYSEYVRREMAMIAVKQIVNLLEACQTAEDQGRPQLNTKYVRRLIEDAAKKALEYETP
jgi:hypothetical protein